MRARHLGTVLVAVLACSACDEDKAARPSPATPPAALKTPTAATQPGPAATPKGDDPETARAEKAARTVRVEVGAEGYHPAQIEAKANETVALVFVRTTDDGCGEELVFPGENLKRTLPLDKEVTVELTPKAGQRIAFTCGMGMYQGAVVAAP